MLASTPATPHPSAPATRLRPGERPAWWDARPDTQAFGLWRREARAAGVTVDVWVALLLETALVLDDLSRARQSEADLAAAAATDRAVVELGPASPLRDWLVRPSPGGDELPELLLPERLVTRLTPGRVLADVLVPQRIELALACDRRAALAGRTLESWALSEILRRHPSPRPAPS